MVSCFDQKRKNQSKSKTGHGMKISQKKKFNLITNNMTLQTNLKIVF